VMQDISNPFFVEVMRGVEDEAGRNGYEIMVCDSDGQPDLEMKRLNALYTQRVDGILLAPSDSYAAREILPSNHAPIVFVDCVPFNAKVTCVVTDNFGASYEATRYLIGLGHRRIAVISGRVVHSTTIDRVEGYRKAMREASLAIREEYVSPGDSRIESGYLCGLSLLRAPHPPTAIFTLNNRMTLGILKAVRELKIPCPERLSVLSFDDSDWAAAFNPTLTAIRQPTYEMGIRAMELLLESIELAGNGNPTESRQILLKSTLQIRESTAPPPQN
jgi:LacI family transcriptional regulator, galactose operon repressor